MIRLKTLLTESPATEKAKALGLAYAGYGRWKDKTGSVVAKSINGGEDLVNLDTAQRAQMSQNNMDNPSHLDQPAPNTDTGHDDISRTPDNRKAPGSSDQDNDELYNEPEDGETLDPGAAGMMEPSPIRRLIHRAGGDANKLRKNLVQKYRKGGPDAEKAKMLLRLLDDYEEGEVKSLRQSLAQLQARKDQQLAAKKQKYAAKYPPVNI